MVISVSGVKNAAIGHELADEEEDLSIDAEEPFDLSSNDANTEASETRSKEPPQLPSSPSDALPKWLRNGRLEWGCCVGLVFVVLQAFIGKKENEKTIESWARTTKDLFNETFEICGFNDSLLKAFSWDYFEFFASGRSNCLYCLVRLQCRPRQCPWQTFILRFLTGNDDMMDVEIPITTSEKFSLVIGRRMLLKTLQSLNKDLGTCISVKRSTLLSPMLTVLSDSGEVVDKLITSDMADVLNNYAKSIRHLILSDIIPSDRFADLTPDNKILRVSIALPSEGRMHEVVPVLKAIFILVDSASNITLSEHARDKVKKAREELQKRQQKETEEERREADEKKKAEKRQEELERVKTMSPESRRKWEDKQQKKEAKAMKPKMKLLHMVKG